MTNNNLFLNPPPAWLTEPTTQKLIKAFTGQEEKLRFVGGAVRDSLLNLPTGDIDAATSLAPTQTTELLEKAGIRVIPTGIKHGTVTALINGKSFEITTLRRDTACDGRHAEVAFTDDWREDAARRDFTVNALYLSPSGELFDYFSGIEDAEAGIIRFIGDARQRIAEDYLRILRFFRFYAYYGKGKPDPEALAACATAAPQIKTLSGERIRGEMFKLLASPAVFSVLTLMDENAVLLRIIGFSCTFDYDRLISAEKLNPEEILVLLLLHADIPASEALAIIAEKWRLPNSERKLLEKIINNISEISPALSEARAKHLIRKLGADIFLALIRIKQETKKLPLPEGEGGGEGNQKAGVYDNLAELAKTWQIPLIPVTGKELIALGIPEGKFLGETLHRLETAWEESNYSLGKEELLKSLKYTNLNK